MEFVWSEPDLVGGLIVLQIAATAEQIGLSGLAKVFRCTPMGVNPICFIRKFSQVPICVGDTFFILLLGLVSLHLLI